MQRLYKNLFYCEPVSQIFTDESFISYMLQFEAALAQAQAAHHLVPPSAVEMISQCCVIENIDVESLITQVALGGNANIPLVKQLTEVVRKRDAEAAKYVHYGATSQDVIDTALVLQCRDAFAWMASDLNQLIENLAVLAERYKHAPMIGRTLGQQARPVTFGFKVAVWLDGLIRSKRELTALQENGTLQLGGAVGTLSGMGDKGLAVCATMSELLNLKMPVIPWHSQRDRIAGMGNTLGILSGQLTKIARDISLLSQTEIGELAEGTAEGRGGSSAMPHKKNPVSCVAILANGKRTPALVSTLLSCMDHDLERSTGSWHAEWETLCDLVQLTAGALRQAVVVTQSLEVNTLRMLQNLELTQGLIYAENISIELVHALGKAKAHDIIEKCCQEAQQKNIHLKSVILAQQEIMKHLTPSVIERVFDPSVSLGLCQQWIDRVLKEKSS